MINQPDKKNYKFDMSPEAIDRRLRELGQLYTLGMAIRQAKHIGKVNDFFHEANKTEKDKEIRH
jgi:hypothetical protein